MLRHESLRPISRDHHDVLALARELRRAAEADAAAGTAAAGARAVAACGAAWRGWLAGALAEQERTLAPRIASDSIRRRFLAGLAGLRATLGGLAARDPGAPPPEPVELRAAYARIQAAVRWVERELFPRLERELDAAELRALGEHWRAIEATRGR